MEHAQHDHRVTVHEIENAVRKRAQVCPVDVVEPHREQERLITLTAEHFLRLAFETLLDARLLPLIPSGRLGEVNPNERVKVELELHGGCP